MDEFEKGLEHLKAQRHEEAVNAFTEFLEREPQHVEARCNRAIGYRHLERHEDSLNDLNAALQAAPADVEVIAERAVTNYHLGDTKNALADFDEAVRLDPANPYRYSSRAYIRASAGDTQGGVDDYLKAIALDPEDMVAHNNLSLLEEKLGRMGSAKKYAQKADELLGVSNNKLPEINPEQPTKHKEEKSPARVRSAMTLLNEMGKVFTTKKGFQEYVKFLSGSGK